MNGFEKGGDNLIFSKYGRRYFILGWRNR